MSILSDLCDLAQQPHDIAGAQDLIASAAIGLEAAKRLEGAVAHFLDADRAWNNNELSVDVVIAAQTAMTNAMYALREAVPA